MAGSSGRRSVDRRIPARRPRAFTLVALISLAAVAVGAVAWARSNVPLERADLEADPSFSLRMQGADELALVGSDRLFTFEGERPPFAGHIYGTMATSADVYAFYERELARLGWQLEAPPFPRSSAELENRVYCKRKVEFRLAIKDKDSAFRAEFYRGRTYTTVFDASLLAIDPAIPCPMPRFTPRAQPLNSVVPMRLSEGTLWRLWFGVAQ